MKKIIIIGGGASGLVCAIKSKNNNNEVIILEKNSVCGKKILATGAGRCNYYNDNQDLGNYYSNSKNIDKIITKENNLKVEQFFKELGVVPKIKNGYYYPMSNQASSIRNILVEKVLSKNIKIIENAFVKDVVKEKVDSWDILWDEKYKDQIFMFDTYRDTIGVALKKLGYSLNSTNKDEIEEAKELLLEQRKLVNPIYGVDNGTTMIPAGETNINMIWSGEGLNLQDEYPNLVYVVPKEGANFWIDSLCITSNAKNVEGAEKFINFVSDKESALRIADEIGYTTPNKEARLEQPKEIQNNPNAYMTKEIMHRCELYRDFDLNTKQMYDDAWTAIKIDSK